MNIDNMFKRHIPDAKQQESMNKLRELAKILAQDIKRLCPGGRNRTVAVEHVEDALMRANKAIVEDSPASPLSAADEQRWRDSLRDKPSAFTGQNAMAGCPGSPAMFGGSTLEQKWKKEELNAALDRFSPEHPSVVELKTKLHAAWVERIKSNGTSSRKLFSDDRSVAGEELLVPYGGLSNLAKGAVETSCWFGEL
jgi:hypothetical protein